LEEVILKPGAEKSIFIPIVTLFNLCFQQMLIHFMLMKKLTGL